MSDKDKTRSIGLLGAIAIGVGGMVGGGIFAVLGLAALLGGGATPIAFAIGGVVALLTAYSYAKLSVAFPSRGGTVIFVDRAFGVDLFTGSVNNLLWIGYIVTLALYAVAFGNYAGTFFGDSSGPLMLHTFISLGIIIPTLLNLLSAGLVSKTETYVVAIKITILIIVIVAGFTTVDPTHLAPATWPTLPAIVATGMIIFVAYEGFELIANAAEDVKDYKRTLPRAFIITVLFVMLLYVLIAIVTVGSLTSAEIASSADFALAQAAKPALGQMGFTLVAISALLATFSAINATLYGAARLSYVIALEGELPARLEREVWHQPIAGLLITTVLALLLANFFDISSISTMGSAGFLLIFAIVNAANFVKAGEIKSNRIVAGAGVFACLAALTVLIGYTLRTSPAQVLVLVGMVLAAVVIEAVYMRFLKKPGRTQRISNR